MRKRLIKLIISAALTLCMIFSLSIASFAIDDDGITPTLSYGDDGFKFITTASDVFLNYFGIMPGTEKSQDMLLINNSQKETEYFVKVSYDDGLRVSREDKELAKRLVDELLTMRIEDKDGNVLYDGPVSGDSSSGIKLATLPANSEKTLEVFISADKEIGNEYQDFSVQVTWSFIIQQDDTPIVIIDDFTPLSPAPDSDPDDNGKPLVYVGDDVPLAELRKLVNTADPTQLLLWVILIVVAISGVTFFAVSKKKKKTSDRIN